MKRLLYFLSFAAMLFVGMACSESDGVDNPTKPESGKAEFTAQFKSLETRVSLNGATQQWEAGDQIVINDTTFTTSETGAKVKFKADKFNAAKGEAVVARYGSSEIATTQSARANNIPLGIPAIAVGEYASGMELTFSSVASFIKFTTHASGDITFESPDGGVLAAMFDVDDDGTVTFATDGSTAVTLKGCEAGKSYYVAIAPVTLKGDLAISVGGKELKSDKSNKTFAANTIYDLGKLTATAEKPEEPKDPEEPEDVEKRVYKIYLYQYQNSWSDVRLYAWDANETKYCGEWPGAKSGGEELFNGHKYLVWDMPVEAAGESISVIFNDGKAEGGAQSADFAIGVLAADCYLRLYGTEVSTIEDRRDPIPADGYEPDQPDTPDQPADGDTSPWALAGTFNDWANLAMHTTESSNLFVAKGVTLDDYAEIKVKDAATWDISYGGGINYLMADRWMTVYNNGSNVAVAEGGTYDIYFELGGDTGKLYLVSAGGAYSAATEQTSNGPAPGEPDQPDTPDTPENPDTPAVGEEYGGWGLVGEHQGWDIANPTPMYKSSTEGLYICENVTLKPTGFKFARRGLENWDGANTYFGAWKGTNEQEYFDFMVEMEVGSWYDVYDNNLGEHATNIGVTDWSKSYDVYLRVVEHAEWGEHLAYTIVEHGTAVSF